MIKRIENWLRRIFTDELSKCQAEIKRLEGSFTSDIARQITLITRIEQSFSEERKKYLAEIHETLVADMKDFRADLVTEKLLIAAPHHWKNEDVKADDQLRHPRPTRR